MSILEGFCPYSGETNPRAASSRNAPSRGRYHVRTSCRSSSSAASCSNLSPPPSTRFLCSGIQLCSKEDLLQAAFPVGTERDNMDKIRDINWCFSNLENAFDEGGELHGKNAYMFGSTEGKFVATSDLQSLKADEDEDDTVIDIIFPPEPLEPLVVCDYDWLVDEVEVQMTGYSILGLLYLKAKEARKKVIEDMDPETRAAMENMKFHEFCPVQTPDMPDISKVKLASFTAVERLDSFFVNRISSACALKKEEDDVRSSSDCCN